MFSVDGHSKWAVVNVMTQVSVYGAWRMRMRQLGILTAHSAHVQTDMAYMRDRDERGHNVMLDTFIRDHMNEHWRPSTVFLYCSLDAPYDGLSFLTWLKARRDAAKCEVKYCTGTDEMYFIRWHNREFLIIPRRERVNR